MNADETVSALLDDAAAAEVDPAARAEVAQRLFLHGMLRATYDRADIGRRVRPRRRGWLRGALSAAAVVLVAALGLFLLGEGATSAEAVVARAQESLERGDVHFRGTLGEMPVELYVRKDRWTLSLQRPLGLFWIGGGPDRMWLATPVGRWFEINQARPLPGDLDPTLLQANLYDALRQMRTFDLGKAERETLGGRRVVRVRGSRPGVRPGALQQVELWADEPTGRIVRVELRIQPPGGNQRRLTLDFADADPRPADFYEPATRRR